MRPSKTTLVLPLAGLLVIGAAGAVAAASAAPDAGASEGIVLAAPSASPSTAPDLKPMGGPREELLTDVLDDLVAKGTLTEAQKTAIVDGLAAAVQERLDTRRAHADQLRTYLEDGVITQDEFDQLPADSRLRQLAGLMDDGQITREELRSMMGGFGGRGGHPFRGGGAWGGGAWGGGAPDAAPDASPAISS